MKDKKNKKTASNPLFNQSNKKSHAFSSAGIGADETLQQYSLLQLVLLKLKSKWQEIRVNFKQNVFRLAQKAIRSVFFWKALALLLVLNYGIHFVRDLSVQFHWPVTITKAAGSNGHVQELGFASFFVGNDAAPSGLSNLQQEKVQNFIRQYAKVAIAEHRKYHIPASIKMAQALVESRAGESTLAQKNHNQFGIKCFSKKCKKGHCTNLTDDSHKDFFRNYHSAWESWRAHSKLLTSDRYLPLQKLGDDYKAWAKGLQKIGYATDKNYAQKLINVIEKYKLYRLDQQ